MSSTVASDGFLRHGELKFFYLLLYSIYRNDEQLLSKSKFILVYLLGP